MRRAEEAKSRFNPAAVLLPSEELLLSFSTASASGSLFSSHV